MATVTEMEKAKKSRSAERSSFTRIANKLRKSIEENDAVKVKVLFENLTNRYKTLKEAQQKVISLMIEANSSEEEIDAEMVIDEKYDEEFIFLKVELDKPNNSLPNQNNQSMVSGTGPIGTSEHLKPRKFKLPTIELKKFDGLVKNWFSFWNTFKKIHEDTTIDDSDKFQYLLQVMEPESRARVIVESFPPSGENYQAALECLKARFGRDELQIEVYVRELLALVLNNIKDNSIPLCTLYDKLESYIRALETLGVTTEKCACMLFPLAESPLPPSLLRVWQRKQRETDVDKNNLSEDRSTSGKPV